MHEAVNLVSFVINAASAALTTPRASDAGNSSFSGAENSRASTASALRDAAAAQVFPAQPPSHSSRLTSPLPPARGWATIAAALPRPLPHSILHLSAARGSLPPTFAEQPASSNSPFVAPRPLLQLPRVQARPGPFLIILAVARAALAAPTSVSQATLVEALALARTVGTSIRLDRRTGEPLVG
ncbi:unnamed protein product [Chondrus crispus]|uniref:Uncharacterized protein n=1 Tax=Chondrus crispus TaxID=2769 RepID=R7QJT9_CHOCR|nr:unnamed protein product [Chondrus crispus]CDF37983.1 unnamed protein product [Chondrus crispus]|eukprot:XP_005717852.1 unnamed protein product [Chondrus crispus]